MGKSKLDPEGQKRCRRVKHYCDVLFHGKVRRMAREFGLSHSVISRVINEVQAPGPGLLQALSEVETVNERWLYWGEGNPLLPPTSGTLPVSDVLLPGQPHEKPEMLTGDRHPVAKQYESESRYWYRTNEQSPETKSGRLLIESGDLLLIESSRERLRIDLVTRMLCVILVGVGEKQTCRIAQVGEVGDQLRAEFFESSPIEPVNVPAIPTKRQGRKVGRRGTAGSPKTREPELTKKAAHQKTSLRVLDGLDSIVGVVLHSERHTLLHH